jgi:voltage-gated potassium channel
MQMNLKRRAHEILRVADEGDRISRYFDISLVILILLNVVAVILETVEVVHAPYSYYFEAFELFSVIIFTVEYLLRIWTCNVDDRFLHPLLGRIRYFFTPLALIDLIAVLPFYLPMVVGLDLRFVRILRLFRLLRLLKIGRYSDSLRTLGSVLKAKKEDLAVTFFALLILLVLISSLLFYFEHDVQPENFPNIPSAMWWGVVTLTTVGYGDVYPITFEGKILGAFAAVLGIGMFALPAGIVASGFAEALQRRRKVRRACPHCGKDLDEPVMPRPDPGVDPGGM